ncbi:MAG: hypothetical protein JXA42_15255 [Anaerolineales bacterium]|nr:hypothetical protein [Anaerolineales bacterium]
MNRTKNKSNPKDGASSTALFINWPLVMGLVVIIALGLVVVSVSALNPRESAPGVEQRPDVTWRSSPLDVSTLRDRAPEEFIYLELLEENTDTFEEPLFVASRMLPPAPFTFEDGVLRVDSQLIKETDEDLGIFIESGESQGRVIYLAHWIFYTGTGRYWEQATYYILNEPSGLVALHHYSGGDAIQFTPFDSLLETLDVRMPGEKFGILETAQDGDVQFEIDGKTVASRAAGHDLMGTQTHSMVVTQQTPYNNTVDHGEITFTTKVTLYNYGAPKSVEFINLDGEEGGN